MLDGIDHEMLRIVVEDHADGRAIASIRPLRKGYSHDHKYIVWDSSGPWLLLRLSPLQAINRREAEFKALDTLFKRGVRCPEPIAVGITPCRSFSFSLVHYIKGECAEDILPGLPEAEQYRLGIAAGEQLWRIHQVPAEEPHETWMARRIAKYRWRVGQAAQLSLSFPGRDAIEDYVEQNLSLLQRSPVRLQHDDYHPGNLVIDGHTFTGVIDFNRCDQGDPIEDFYKVPWFTIRTSIAFACGQVDGYLAQEETPGFWARYNLFVAMNLHGSLVWERENSDPSRQRQWLRCVREIVESHDWAGRGFPKWYRQGC